MKKKLLVSLIGCMLVFSLVGCGKTTILNVNIENSDNLNNNILGKQSFIEIGSGLFYDSATRIVYMVNGLNSLYESETYCPYYAPNGLPYRYNSETNTFEEIENSLKETFQVRNEVILWRI